jgi:hypothetical protein
MLMAAGTVTITLPDVEAHSVGPPEKSREVTYGVQYHEHHGYW